MKQERKYFGTDGIRGIVGTPPITPDFILKLGWAVGRILKNGYNKNKVLIGKDTRISGYMFESALQAGLSAAGMDIRLLGPMPTPAIAYLTRTFHAVAGIVISASHNPFQDNGIKFFSGDGTKLPDEVELAIEAEMEQPMQTVAPSDLGKAERIEDAAGRYIEFCKSTIPYDISLKGLKIVVDCAHGATYHIAPNVFRELGASVETIGTQPNGLNINAGYGATQPQALQNAVLYQNADLGIALDGDGDRVLMVDGKGEIVDGDELLFIIAQARHKAGCLQGAVVGTVMSNLGLEQALEKQGIAFKRAAVGDRYVLEMLQQNGGNLGGESSGHIICLDRTTTGDGITTALQVLAVSIQTGLPLHVLKKGMQKCPQRMINVPITPGVEIASQPSVQKAIEEAEQQLSHQGRVLLRPSGTEPLIRVMVEGTDVQQVEAVVHQLADVVKAEQNRP
ncbi:phosphoglucosamine mutase [Candidatus Parabeggiatoa sp. HSG14]|uniref:phosphoglucosamine mutase n=1 Tax=Candidatus Parabeggiatoa sp. HSG14 TaxID=3055593 RepID=UPI0025A6C3B6|nr:phosphoglucosamine mutase [Thiotrichales bacterium HSG14]